MKLLLIEQAKDLAKTVKSTLDRKDITVDTVSLRSAPDAQAEIYDLVILDATPEDWDGFTLIRLLRAKRESLPILMLTGEGPDARAAGLETGADYCLSFPFSARELLACVSAMLRRNGAPTDEIIWGNTVLDLSSCTLSCGEQSVRLSAREFNVMRFLMQTGKKNLDKETILTRVWGDDSDATENYVEVYVGFLRKKLRQIGSNIRIAAVRWKGYHLEIDE